MPGIIYVTTNDHRHLTHYASVFLHRPVLTSLNIVAATFVGAGGHVGSCWLDLSTSSPTTSLQLPDYPPEISGFGSCTSASSAESSSGCSSARTRDFELSIASPRAEGVSSVGLKRREL